MGGDPVVETEDFVAVIDGALDGRLCADIIDRFERSGMSAPGRIGGGIDADKKKSMDLNFTGNGVFEPVFAEVIKASSVALLGYIDRYHHALVGPIGLTVLHPQTGQPVKLTAENYPEIGRPHLPGLVNHVFRIGVINTQKYPAGEGGYPYWHSEIYPQLPDNDPLHRTLLFMFYLNDVAEGGETEFVYQRKAIRPKAGRMVIAPAGFTHTHRGAMPISNDKYILTSWLLFNRAETLFGAA